MTLNANSYRDILRKKIVESDLPSVDGTGSPAKGPVRQTVPNYSGVLNKLREKLFGPATEDSNGQNGAARDGVTSNNDMGVGVANEDSYQHTPEAPNGLESPNTGSEMGPESDEATLNAEDLNDMATDTIAEVLNSIKELRDTVKKENPKKAALVRRIYDHLLKGKDKITAEILKSHEEEKAQHVESPVAK